jgi:hypothetical protein
MANKNIAEVYDDNPSTALPSNALMYAGLSPYDVTDDTAILFSNLKAQISGAIVLVTTNSALNLLPNTVYITSSGLQPPMTLSTSFALGDWVKIISIASAGFKVLQHGAPSSQRIFLGTMNTVSGSGGYVIPKVGEELGAILLLTAVDSSLTFFAEALAGNFYLQET